MKCKKIALKRGENYFIQIRANPDNRTLKNTSRCREVLRFIRLPDGADTVRIRSFSDLRRFPTADSG